MQNINMYILHCKTQSDNQWVTWIHPYVLEKHCQKKQLFQSLYDQGRTGFEKNQTDDAFLNILFVQILLV